MRIGLVLHGWPADTMGGTGLYVDALARALVELGHQVAVLSPRIDPGSSRPPWVEGSPEPGGFDSFRVVARPPRRWEETWRRPAMDAAFRGWLGRWSPDLVHVHHLAHGSFGWLRAVRQEGRGLVLTLHDYALPCARGQLITRELQPCDGPSPAGCASCVAEQLMLSPATAAIGRELSRWPLLHHRARALGGARPAPSPASQGRAGDRLAAMAAALHLPHHLLAPSADLCDRFADMGLRRPRQQDLPLVRAVPPAPAPTPGPVRFLFASSVIPTKGPDRLLAAFARLPLGAATLTIAGPTPPFDGRPDWALALRARVRTTPGAQWQGACPPSAVPALLAEHDVLVLPSIWPENSPLVLREASAAGLRVILPAVGGAAELLPAAPRVGPQDDAGLLAALLEQVRLGRGRAAPVRWPTPLAHARALSREVYEPAAR